MKINSGWATHRDMRVKTIELLEENTQRRQWILDRRHEQTFPERQCNDQWCMRTWPMSPVVTEGKAQPLWAMLPTHLYSHEQKQWTITGVHEDKEKMESLRTMDGCGWCSVILIILVDCHVLFELTESDSRCGVSHLIEDPRYPLRAPVWRWATHKVYDSEEREQQT